MCVRRSAPRWLSSFFPDYILLVLVFPASLLFQIYLWVQKVDAYRETGTEEDIYTDWKLPEYEVLIHADSFFFIYLSVLVTGFLFTTLEYHLVASEASRGEFTAVLSLFIVLWSMNFFTTQDDRYTYAAVSWSCGSSWFNVDSAAHSTHHVMLSILAFLNCQALPIS